MKNLFVLKYFKSPIFCTKDIYTAFKNQSDQKKGRFINAKLVFCRMLALGCLSITHQINKKKNDFKSWGRLSRLLHRQCSAWPNTPLFDVIGTHLFLFSLYFMRHHYALKYVRPLHRLPTGLRHEWVFIPRGRSNTKIDYFWIFCILSSREFELLCVQNFLFVMFKVFVPFSLS